MRMNDTYTKRVSAAAAAGWWTVLVGVLWLTFGWLAWMAILHFKPDWLLTLWVGMSWDDAREFMILFLGTAKMILLVCFLATLWLTFWARGMKRLPD